MHAQCSSLTLRAACPSSDLRAYLEQPTLERLPRSEPVNPTPRPRRRWRKLLIVGIGAAFIGLLTARYGIQTLAGRKWGAMKPPRETLRGQSRSRPPSPPALYPAV